MFLGVGITRFSGSAREKLPGWSESFATSTVLLAGCNTQRERQRQEPQSSADASVAVKRGNEGEMLGIAPTHKRVAGFLRLDRPWCMRVDLASFGVVVAPLLLAACSAAHPDSSAGSAGSGNSEAPANPAGANEPSRFQPVPRAQPTEGGAWVVDPGDPMTLYALGERSMRSRDGGQSWSELNWPVGARYLTFASKPTPALYLQASGWNGTTPLRLLESTDDGETWSDTGATDLSGELKVVPGENGLVLLDDHDGRLVRSTDKGTSWDPVELSNETAFYSLRTFFMSGGASPVVYLLGWSLQAPLFVSTDAGATFVAKAVPSTRLELSLDCQGRLYTVEDETVYRSDDAASSWNAVFDLDATVYGFQVASGVPAACSDTVYAHGFVAGGGSTLWQLDGSTATSRGLPDLGQVMDLGDGRLLGLSSYGLRQRSDDGGRTWWTAGVDLQAGQLVISPARGGSLFVSTSRGVFSSDDGGMTWQGPSAGPRIMDPYLDPNDLDVLYGRSIYGDDSPWSYISTDRGASFENWPVPSAAHPEVPEAIASTAPGELTIVTRNGAYSTVDSGQHFTQLLSVPMPKQVMWATISRHDPPAIYAYVGGDDSAPDELLASVDGGATWASRDPGTYLTFLTVDPADRAVLFALAGSSDEEGQALRTRDGGLTWDRFSLEGETYFRLEFDPQPPHALYAVGKSLHRSEDGGDTWQTVTELPADLREFSLDPNESKARYVLGETGLLYKMTE